MSILSYIFYTLFTATILILFSGLIFIVTINLINYLDTHIKLKLIRK